MNNNDGELMLISKQKHVDSHYSKFNRLKKSTNTQA